jgi:tRNA A-37 threonylcarbamoyl transferase component Bud32
MARGIDEPWIAASSLPPELGRDWARDWPSWFVPGHAELPRAPGRADLSLLETALGRVVAKRVRARGWKRSLESLRARVPRGERAFRRAGELLAHGFATPAPLAVLGRPGEAVLVTRYVDGRGPWELLREVGSKAVLLEVLARGLARLHGAGLRHRDLKASNLLFVGTPASPELVWTDLDGLAFVGTVEPRLRARDLARLATSFESAEARAAGVRAGDWPELVERYLACALGRAPSEEELSDLCGWTKRWSERWIRRHLAEGKSVR